MAAPWLAAAGCRAGRGRAQGSRQPVPVPDAMVAGAADGGKPVTRWAWWPAWYRLRAGWRRDWAGYLAIAVIVGLLGGIAMASVVAARRTQSAFPRILAASNASDLHVDPGPYSARVAGQISRLPRVRSAESYVALYGLRALRSGFADPRASFNQQVELVGSLDGLYFDQDRVIITSGRRANPGRPGEIVISEQAARRFGLRIGQSLTINLYSPQQAGDPGFDFMTRQPVHRVRLRITGIGVFTDEVVQDDIDRIIRLLATRRSPGRNSAAVPPTCGPACGWPAATAMWPWCSASSASCFRREPRECSGSHRSSKAKESGRFGPCPSPPARSA